MINSERFSTTITTLLPGSYVDYLYYSLTINWYTNDRNTVYMTTFILMIYKISDQSKKINVPSVRNLEIWQLRLNRTLKIIRFTSIVAI